MHGLLLTVIVRTIPKVPANEYQDSKLVIKSRNAWKKEIQKNLIIMISAIISLLIFDKLPIPYIGIFLMFYGFFGILEGFFMMLRAYVVYKHYYEIYRDEDIKKIEE